ncbi:phosphate ABC transporter substrate-binding protein [Photobacterium sp. ZSDE20]|uniref:Phosphate-binding protein n=1 Tax=Photobacterium pectinilyticum TaxID=2906793 RepID=A0ABT1NBJ9_9GAMM|nr:phosphate ABC transporter substrate-binding protein [Photobacterium sp. ZSDE20]MCQ1061199.1 phosphate ABC transporter substrate-binding protein [Photobacterium sp. ZSDE20]MDD1829566.1 phosphate ABC transporter substrate-binding protein [Photobacterium sp. ZSDE20]
MKHTFIAATLTIAALSGSALAQENISAVGSSSVSPLMEVFGETYQQIHPEVFIEVQGPGSSAGVRAAKDKSADLGMASRELASSEKETDLHSEIIARDGIAVVVNPSNSVDSLTAQQIHDIYAGDIKNWKEVGGEDKPIVAVTRDTASGTRGAFEEIMQLTKKINGQKVSAISQHAQVSNGNGHSKTMAAQNPFAISYISLGSVDSSVVPVTVDGTPASVENVKNGSYKVARPFQVLYKGTPNTRTQQFLDWMLSAEAQAIVADQGYISIN